MGLPLLVTTKLYFPLARHNLIARPRLVEKVCEGLKAPFTLISAPPGYGKTTLLSEWRARAGRGFPAAWLSIDKDDNDPARFLTYLAAALGTIQTGLGDEIVSQLQSPQTSTQAILASLINEIARLRAPFCLVLDDYHLITAQPVHDLLIYILDHQPPLMHLVMLTRADPPLPLARMRARSQIFEIRAADLRFTLDEITNFLTQVMEVTLSPHDIAALEKRTEGWAAGLQLAALSLRRIEDPAQFIATFGGGYHYIVDYLVEEVLNRQAESMREFLLQTSILERLTGPLCDAVTRRTDGPLMLEQLEKANLFLSPLDGECCWYRYHHLFADVLRNRLRQLHPDWIPELHYLAANWYEQHGFDSEAIHHALTARDFEYAASLIERVVATMSLQGRVAGVSAWIEALPGNVIASRPRLGIAQAWALYFEFKFDQAEARLREIERNLPAEVSPQVGGEMALLCGVIARRHNELERSFTCLQEALEKLPAENHYFRCLAWVFLGLVNLENDANKAQLAFSQAIITSETARNIHGHLTASYFLTWTRKLQGSLQDAAAISRRALALAENIPHWPVASFAYAAMGEILFEWNDIERAGACLQMAVELAESGGNADCLYTAALALSRVHRTRGEWEEAEQRLDQAESLAQRMFTPFLMALVTDEWVRIWLAKNELQKAMLWLREHIQSSDCISTLPCALDQIAWARLDIASREPQKALQRLTSLVEQVEAGGMTWLLIQILTLQALALEMDGQTDQALTVFARALTLAEPEGHVRTFLDEGAPMAPLLRRARSQGIAPTYVTRLISEFSKEYKSENNVVQLLVEPLSNRELEVLRLIAAGCSNKEIASQLFITVSTVKRHTVTIFQKLGVDHRTQAVAKARELKLI